MVASSHPLRHVPDDVSAHRTGPCAPCAPRAHGSLQRANRNLTILICAPATPRILAELGSTNELDGTLIVAMWNLGATLGCLVVGPLSEIHGRRPVYNVANLLCLALLAAETQSRSVGVVVALRCLNGVAVATTALNPSIVADLFVVEERGRAQSLLALMPLLGPALGPVVGGWVAQAKGWRWTFWVAFFVLALFSVAFVGVYRETYDAAILRRKAARLRAESGNARLRSRYDHSLSAATVLRKAFVRPVKIFRIPIFLVLALSGCLLSGYVYLLATTLTPVLEASYALSSGAAGLAFLGLALGMAAGALFCSVALDRHTKRMKARRGEIKPEWRLPPMSVGFVVAPAGLLLYGWSAQAHVQYVVVPIVGTALVGFAAYTVTIPVTTYLADVFATYRASAMSALTMARNAVSLLLPLAGPPLYRALGLGWGNSVLAFGALALVPVPLVLLRYGERLRRSSRIEEWS